MLQLVEEGHLDRSDFRAFTCDNAIALLAGARPDFFDGTAVESHARGRLAAIGA